MSLPQGLALGALLALVAGLAPSRLDDREPPPGPGGRAAPPAAARRGPVRIDLMAPAGQRQKTAPAPGWIAYRGERYSPERGHGWLDELPSHGGADRGEDATIVLADGTRTSARRLGRPELAHWQGTHQENRPRVFRVDLPSGWYRVACTSVDPGTPLPLVDQRGFKCRANDAVFAGPRHGRPLATGGATLVEGEDVVEVTGDHLRVVVGDPAYAGWTWRHPGAWYAGWDEWWGRWGGQRYAEGWWQKLTRRVDPGFHSLRLNSLRIEPVAPPARPARVVFRDRFDRDDASDVNRDVPEEARWLRHDLHPGARVEAALSATALTLTASSRAAVALVQRGPSPARGRVRYSTRVSLATGEGGQVGHGVHEAGLLLLGDPTGPGDTRSTFVGVRLAGPDGGGVIVRVGDRRDGYQADQIVSPPRLPFEVTAGEHEIVVDHDVAGERLDRIAVDGVDVTRLVGPGALRQPVGRGVFGIRALMDPGASGVTLTQSYWVFRVECLPATGRQPSC
jgi:hypothetical protein